MLRISRPDAILPAAGLAPAILVLSLSLTAGAQDIGAAVATVNGQPITLAEILALHEGFAEQLEGVDDQAAWDLMLDQLAQQEALAQQAEAAPTARDQAAIALSRRAYMAASALERVAAPEPDADVIATLYAEHFGNAGPVAEYHAAHILVETEEAAQAAAEALSGGVDFAEVARERSTDATGPNGGDLGWFTLDVMVQPFAQAVEALEPGEVSEPFESQFGWHIAQLIETRMQQPPSLDEVRDQLVIQARRNRVEAAADAALRDAEVVRNPDFGPDILSRTDLLED